MNQNDYMDKLNKALSSFEDEIRDEIISDYEEHFRMGALNGKSEEQISEELGSIDELIAELNALSAGSVGSQVTAVSELAAETAETAGETSDKTEEAETEGCCDEEAAEAETETETETEEDSADKTYRSYSENVARALGALGAELCKRSEQLARSFKDKADSFDGSKFTEDLNDEAEKFAQAMNQGAEKVTETASRFAKQIAESFDASMGGRKPFSWKDLAPKATDDFAAAQETEEAAEADEEDSQSFESTNSGAVTGVIINGDCAHVIIEAGSDDTCHFEYNNYGSKNQQLAYRFYHRVEGSVIYAGVERVPTRSRFFDNINNADIELKVSIPAGLECMQVETRSGDIDCEDLSAGAVKLKSVSGDICMGGCRVAALNLQTASGDIDVSSNQSKELIVHTASGDVTLFSNEIDSLNIYTASGDVELNSNEVIGMLIDSASGDIQASGFARKVSSKTASGDIEMEVSRISEVALSTVSGDVDLEMSQISGYTANVKTISGDIDLSYGDVELEDLKGGVYTLGSGETRVTVSTVSGDITVDGEA